MSISKILSLLLQMERVELGVWETAFFPFQRKLYIFSIFFLIYFGKIYIWPVYHSLDKRIWFTIIFFLLKESLILFQIWIIFIIPSLILSQLELSKIELPKLIPSILMKNCGHSICPGWSILFLYATLHKVWLLKSLSSNWMHLLLRGWWFSSSKFTTLISWSSICIRLILIP